MSREHVQEEDKTYWLVKSMIAQVLDERSIPQQDILHRFELLEGKFEIVCKVVFGIKIVVSQVNEEVGATYLKEGPHDSIGIHANPICIE